MNTLFQITFSSVDNLNRLLWNHWTL